MSSSDLHSMSPFKFLDAYGAGDRDMFFGRDEEIQELYERLLETNLVLLYGPSGTGKSSLIQCGLANLFRPSEWLPLFVRRERDFNDQLREVITDAFPPGKQPSDPSQLELSQLIRQLYLVHFRPVYLIFDQFEEIFILGEQEEIGVFFRQLQILLMSGVQVKVLLSMREEYIAYLSDYEHLVPDLFDNRMRLEKMGRSKLREVVGGTAERFNIEITDSEQTIDAIIENLRDNRGEVELVNLQIYLDKLWRNDQLRQQEEGRQRPVHFTGDLVRQTQKLEDVLSDFLEDQLLVMEKELLERGHEKQGLPMAVLLALVTEDGTKRIRTTNQIKNEIGERKKVDTQLVDYCIDRFSELRLIKILGIEEKI